MHSDGVEAAKHRNTFELRVQVTSTILGVSIYGKVCMISAFRDMTTTLTTFRGIRPSGIQALPLPVTSIIIKNNRAIHNTMK